MSQQNQTEGFTPHPATQSIREQLGNQADQDVGQALGIIQQNLQQQTQGQNTQGQHIGIDDQMIQGIESLIAQCGYSPQDGAQMLARSLAYWSVQTGGQQLGIQALTEMTTALYTKQQARTPEMAGGGGGGRDSPTSFGTTGGGGYGTSGSIGSGKPGS